MRVGFLNNQIDNRGTGNATYDYAHYNETILGNESKIYTFAQGNHDANSTRRFTDRFSEIRYIETIREVADVDVLYHIKYGNNEGERPRQGIIYAPHAVFTVDPHGDRYAAISRWLAAGRVNVVPHIVQVSGNQADWKTVLGIRKDDIVFGRYGGYDTFDIHWVWDAIMNVTAFRDDIWFLFANTERPQNVSHRQVGFTSALVGPSEKAQFINTCDYMIHARSRGETFGISCGEFAIKGKPVLTYGASYERAHLDELGTKAITYENQDTLEYLLLSLGKPKETFAYTEFTPEQVMAKFEKVFLR